MNDPGSKAAGTGEGEVAEAPPRIEFQHRLFSIDKGVYFRISESKTHVPIMMFDSGDTQLALPVDGIKDEFDIPDNSPDGLMLDTVVRALDFVAVIRPGDLVPSELTTGDVSWEIAERHKLIARQRLMVQLISWHAGEEAVVTDAKRLQELTDDLQTKARIEAAYAEAAAQLGHDGIKPVSVAVGRLSETLAGIEALRERHGHVLAAEERIQTLRGRYTSNMSIFEVVDRVSRLAAIATEDLARRLAAIDKRTGTILSLLENCEVEIKAISKVRDDLHRRLAAWNDILQRWHAVGGSPHQIEGEVWYETYRFLAPRYMPVDEWVLLAGLHTQPIQMTSQVVW